MSWQRKGRLFYEATNTEFKVSIRPSTWRCIVLVALYTFVSIVFFANPQSAKSLNIWATPVLYLFFSWPLLADLKELYPATVYRDGRVKKTFFMRKIPSNTKIFVYYKPSLKFTNIGLSYRDKNRKRKNIKIKCGDSYSSEYEFVARELAKWMNVNYQEQS
jgi:hypothetical protein